MVNPEEVDTELSNVDEKHREVFDATAERLEYVCEGFERVSDVVDSVKDEEITLLEGQEKIDDIVDEYHLPRFR